jgi:PKD repeat protein
MVTRSRQAILLTGVLVSVAWLGLSCEKVPLLAPTGSTITLSTATSALGFNGTAEIVAQVLEAAGTPPHSGTHVTFSTNLGSFEPAEAQTDVNGRATTRFRAGTSSGIATITASSGGATVATANTVKIAVGSAAVGGIVASANPAIVSSRGGSSAITAKVTDSGGNALAGIPVTFTTDAGSLSSSVVNTDANGIATTTLSTNKTAKVTATAGVTTTTTGSDGRTTTTAPATSTVTVTVNSTQAITIGTPSPASPTVGQTVSFPLTYPASTTGASPIERISVNWGDGRTDNLNGTPPSISHAYGSPGSYLVVVTGFDALGDTSTASASVTVTPAPRPTVTISASPSNPAAGAVVTFTITATATPGNSITSIFVDFNDGQSATLSGNATTVQHVFANAGTYQVTATATDTSGQSGSGSTVIVVGQGAPVTADFTISPASSSTHPATISFNGSSSSSPAGITNYSWDFGDPSGVNNTLSGPSPSQQHTYNNAGTYTVTLTVTDGAGRTASKQKSVTIG